MMKDGKQIYRDPSRGPLAGVCFGLSQYFGIELWLVRIAFVAGSLLSSIWLGIVVYIACCFIIEKRSDLAANQNDEEQTIVVKQKVWQKGEPPRRALFDLKERFQTIDKRIQHLEKFVTSKEFTVSREINKL